MNQNWNQDFREFLDAPEIPPPQSCQEKILIHIHRALNPNLGQVFSRLCAIHVFASLFTITLCPHFGVQIIPGFHGLMGVFMPLGAKFCMIACGGIFMATGFAAAALFLPSEYVMALKRQRLLHAVLLTFFSCAGLTLLGGTILWTTIPFWIAGGLVGSLASLQWVPRLRLLRVRPV